MSWVHREAKREARQFFVNDDGWVTLIYPDQVLDADGAYADVSAHAVRPVEGSPGSFLVTEGMVMRQTADYMLTLNMDTRKKMKLT